MTKTCRTCHEEKPLERFGKTKRGNHRGRCKTCHSRNGIAYRRGLSLDEYVTMLEEADGHCVICGVRTDEALQLDHNHKTGKTRGLLCRKCNLAVAFIENNPKLVRKWIRYVLNDGNGPA